MGGSSTLILGAGVHNPRRLPLLAGHVGVPERREGQDLILTECGFYTSKKFIEICGMSWFYKKYTLADIFYQELALKGITKNCLFWSPSGLKIQILAGSYPYVSKYFQYNLFNRNLSLTSMYHFDLKVKIKCYFQIIKVKGP